MDLQLYELGAVRCVEGNIRGRVMTRLCHVLEVTCKTQQSFLLFKATCTLVSHSVHQDICDDNIYHLFSVLYCTKLSK